MSYESKKLRAGFFLVYMEIAIHNSISMKIKSREVIR